MKILIGYDGFNSSDAALDDLRRAGLPRVAEAWVVTIADVLAASIPSRYEVTTHVLAGRQRAEVPTIMSVRAAEALKEAKELASGASARLRTYFPEWQIRAEGLSGKPSWALIQRADELQADLIVVGSQGRSALGRLLLGSVSKTVATEAGRAVRIARRGPVNGNGAPPRIIVGVDGSSESERAVRAVGERDWPGGTQVRIIAVDDGTSPTRVAHIMPNAAAMITGCNEEVAVHTRAMVEWAQEDLSAIGLDASIAVFEGDPRRVLVEEARKWGADSIFIGPRRFTSAFERFRLGSVSSAVATKAHCSVEVVR